MPKGRTIWWIPLRCDLNRQPTFAMILDRIGKEALGTDRLHAENALIGALFRVWSYVYQDGEEVSPDDKADWTVAGLSPQHVDAMTGVDGLAEALESEGWMAFDEDGARAIRFSKRMKAKKSSKQDRDRAARNRKKAADKGRAAAARRTVREPCANGSPTETETETEITKQPQPPAGAGGEVVVDSEPAAGEGSRRLAELGVRDPEALARADRAAPDLLAWVLAEAPKKDNPPGWARTAIVEGWAPPEGWGEQREAERKGERRQLERAQRWEAFRAMTPEKRAEVAEHAATGHFINSAVIKDPPERPTDSQAIAVSLAVLAWEQADGSAP